jgi:MoxR-like ATPase
MTDADPHTGEDQTEPRPAQPAAPHVPPRPNPPPVPIPPHGEDHIVPPPRPADEDDIVPFPDPVLRATEPDLPRMPPSEPVATAPVAEPAVEPGTREEERIERITRTVAPDPTGDQIQQMLFEIRRVIVGQQRVVERVLAALLAGGHCLLEGAPGLGKTKMVSTLARTLGGSFSRLQFTPDLLPSDVVGTRVYRASTESFDVELGPIFANFVLADEINRAPAKVQSALLEVMEEQQVTIGGRSFAVPKPFLVMATQNPIESEGVYVLPEAQRDRFLMRVPVDYPSPLEEAEIVRRAGGPVVAPARILKSDDVTRLQARTREIHVDPLVADYAVRLVLATRAPAEHGLPELVGRIAFGASPRASIGLLSAGRAMALLRGRPYVLPQDVFDIAYDVLNHRIVLSFDAMADGVTVDEVLVRLLSTVRAPTGVGVPADDGL